MQYCPDRVGPVRPCNLFRSTGLGLDRLGSARSGPGRILPSLFESCVRCASKARNAQNGALMVANEMRLEIVDSFDTGARALSYVIGLRALHLLNSFSRILSYADIHLDDALRCLH